MNIQKTLKYWIILAPILAFAFPLKADSLPEIEGVFGLTNIGDSSALAFWVPLEEGESISGITWFNNAGDVVFPEVRAIAGSQDQPEILSAATTVGLAVQGGSLSWDSLDFFQPIASASEGLYVIFLLPENGVFTQAGHGGGAGFGFQAGSGFNRSWVTTNGTSWTPFTTDNQMAILPAMNNDKSGSVLILSPEGCQWNQDEDLEFIPLQPDPLLSAIPNPFNPQTTISFHLPRSEFTSVKIFDIRGHAVHELWAGHMESGAQEIIWDGKTRKGTHAPSGVYLIQVSGNQFQETARITLTK